MIRPAEVTAAISAAQQAGAVAACEAEGFAKGGAGMTDLASAVWDAAHSDEADVQLLYEDDMPLVDKVDKMAKRLYQAAEVEWGPLTSHYSATVLSLKIGIIRFAWPRRTCRYQPIRGC